jgi:hypothetical protein
MASIFCECFGLILNKFDFKHIKLDINGEKKGNQYNKNNSFTSGQNLILNSILNM